MLLQTRPLIDIKELGQAPARCRSSIISSSTGHCRSLFQESLSSESSSLNDLIVKNMSDGDFCKDFFTKLSRHCRLLLVLTDYTCHCGCRFSVTRGSFVLQNRNESSSNNHSFVSVVSNRLICSRIPSNLVCDLNSIRKRVRRRCIESSSTTMSFDL